MTKNSPSKITPGSTAKDWAREHPEEHGRIKVKSLAPRGRGGWKGLAPKETTFYVDGGLSAQTKESSSLRLFNGICQCCGQVYLNCDLEWAWAPDPEAGQILSNEPYIYLRQTLVQVRGINGTLVACQACIEYHQLNRDWKPGYKIDYETHEYQRNRRHPVYCKFDLTQDEILVTLDIRQKQEAQYA